MRECVTHHICECQALKLEELKKKANVLKGVDELHKQAKALEGYIKDLRERIDKAESILGIGCE